MKSKENLFWGIFGIVFLIWNVYSLTMFIIRKMPLWIVIGIAVTILMLYLSITAFSDYYKKGGKGEGIKEINKEKEGVFHLQYR